MIGHSLFFDVTSLPPLPDWVPPSVLVVIGLAGLIAFLNIRGVWVSGREHTGALAAQAAQYEKRLSEKDERLAYVESRREEERTSRLEDAKAFGQVAAQLQTASEDLREVEALFGDENRSAAERRYNQRLGARKRNPSPVGRDRPRSGDAG